MWKRATVYVVLPMAGIGVAALVLRIDSPPLDTPTENVSTPIAAAEGTVEGNVDGGGDTAASTEWPTAGPQLDTALPAEYHRAKDLLDKDPAQSREISIRLLIANGRNRLVLDLFSKSS